MAGRSRNKGHQIQDTAKDPAVLDAVKPFHQAEADVERRHADARAHEAGRTPQDAGQEEGSPKCHGDKMEHAVRSSAGRTEKR